MRWRRGTRHAEPTSGRPPVLAGQRVAPVATARIPYLGSMRALRHPDVRCDGCAARWDAATARFCGRCGLPLGDAVRVGTPGGHEARPAGRRSRSTLLVASLLAAVTLLAGVVVAGGLARSIGEGRADGAAPGVELPDRADLGADRPDDPVSSATDPGDPAAGGPIDCRPSGCARWQADLGPGSVTLFHDLLVHIGEPGMTAVDVHHGEVRWTAPVQGSGASTQVIPVEGGPDLLVSTPGGTLAAHDPLDGRVRWEVALPGRAFRAAATSDTVLVHGESVGLRLGNAASATAPSAFLANLDRVTGEPRWVRTELEIIDLDAELPLVRLPADVLAGLDPRTGESRWRRAFSPSPLGATQFAQGVGRVVLADGGGVTILDAETGDVERQVGIEAAPSRWIRVIGQALVVTEVPDDPDAPATSRRSSRFVTVIDLQDPLSEPHVFRGISQVHDLGQVVDPVRPRPLRGAAGAAPGAPDGLLLTATDPGALVLHRLSAAGETIWRRHILHGPAAAPGSAACCWSLQPAAERGSFLAIPPGRIGEQIRRIAADGRILDRFDPPLALREVADPRWHGRTAIGPVITDGREATLVVGPQGTAEVSGPAIPVTTDPLVLRTPSGLLALDPRFLGVPG